MYSYLRPKQNLVHQNQYKEKRRGNGLILYERWEVEYSQSRLFRQVFEFYHRDLEDQNNTISH